MAFSEMTAKERTIVAVLAVVIIMALVGIGVLVAKLISNGGDGGLEEGIQVPEVTAAAPGPQATATLVPNPVVEGLGEEVPATISEQPVVVARIESSAPLLPAMLLSQPLRGGHRYRLEITAADGSSTAFRGSWSQTAKGQGVELEMPLPESIEGRTPFVVNITPPVANPVSWSVSASAGPQDLVGSTPGLVITIWDVTGVK
jgi:hypothetical protein